MHLFSLAFILFFLKISRYKTPNTESVITRCVVFFQNKNGKVFNVNIQHNKVPQNKMFCDQEKIGNYNFPNNERKKSRKTFEIVK